MTRTLEALSGYVGAAIGALFALYAHVYLPFTTPEGDVGPGLLPVLSGLALCILGVLIALRARPEIGHEPMPKLGFRHAVPLLAVGVFVALISWAGLALTIFTTAIAVSVPWMRQVPSVRRLLIYLGLFALGSTVLFGMVLRLPIPLWPSL